MVTISFLNLTLLINHLWYNFFLTTRVKIGYFTNGKVWSWVDFEDVLAPCSRLNEKLNSFWRAKAIEKNIWKKRPKTCVLRMYLTVTVPPPAISDVSQLKRKHEGNLSQKIDLSMTIGIKNIPANRTCVPDMAQSSPQELKPPLKLAGILIVEPSFQKLK